MRQLLYTLVLGLLVPSLFAAEELDMNFDVTGTMETDALDGLENQKPWRLHISYLQNWHLPQRQTDLQHLDLKLQVETLLAEQLYAVVDATLVARIGDDSQIDASQALDWDSRVQALYLQGRLDQFSMKAGYQTAVWGKMDMLGVTDRLSPWDFSQFAYTAPQDARIAQGIITASHFINFGTEAEFVYNVAPQVNRYPGGGARYLLEQQLGYRNFSLDEAKPQTFSDYELALRLKLSRGSFDGTFTIARLLQNDPYFEFVATDQFRALYPDYYLLAYSYNFAGDGVLWKLALAYSAKRSLFLNDKRTEMDSIQWGGGVDLNLGNDLILSAEATYAFLDLPGTAPVQRNDSRLATRVSKSFMHKDLETVYYFQYHVEDHAQTHSGSLSYHLNDEWSVDLVCTVFEVNDSQAPTQFMDDWDSVSIKTTYSW
ncbi:MAG: hypothetical protein OEZ68_13760 [Gammaproteobacteria bacterium]|nr:hypothetical protein [Gammaproteobacteria bacterium]MDH5801868.1 hypothetical protein [Gammaproteobacteria bacterium]